MSLKSNSICGNSQGPLINSPAPIALGSERFVQLEKTTGLDLDLMTEPKLGRVEAMKLPTILTECSFRNKAKHFYSTCK